MSSAILSNTGVGRSRVWQMGGGVEAGVCSKVCRKGRVQAILKSYKLFPCNLGCIIIMPHLDFLAPSLKN
jgi:hypothetical protein